MDAAGTKTETMASFKKSFEGLKGTSHSAAKGVTDTAGTKPQLGQCKACQTENAFTDNDNDLSFCVEKEQLDNLTINNFISYLSCV